MVFPLIVFGRCSCPLGIIMDRWSQRSNALNGTLTTEPSSIFGLAGFTSCERCRYNREKDLCWCCEKHGGLLNSLTKKLQKPKKQRVTRSARSWWWYVHQETNTGTPSPRTGAWKATAHRTSHVLTLIMKHDWNIVKLLKNKVSDFDVGVSHCELRQRLKLFRLVHPKRSLTLEFRTRGRPRTRISLPTVEQDIDSSENFKRWEVLIVLKLNTGSNTLQSKYMSIWWRINNCQSRLHLMRMKLQWQSLVNYPQKKKKKNWKKKSQMVVNNLSHSYQCMFNCCWTHFMFQL